MSTACFHKTTFQAIAPRRQSPNSPAYTIYAPASYTIPKHGVIEIDTGISILFVGKNICPVVWPYPRKDGLVIEPWPSCYHREPEERLEDCGGESIRLVVHNAADVERQLERGDPIGRLTFFKQVSSPQLEEVGGSAIHPIPLDRDEFLPFDRIC